MTIIAGIYAWEDGIGSHLRIWNSIKRLLSRDNYDNIIEFVDQKCCFAKIDIGAFDRSDIYSDSEGNFSMLAGDPLLNPVTKNHNRHQDLIELHKSLFKEEGQKFQYTRGMFCAAFYCSKKNTLTLIVDKFGLRPLYYCRLKNAIVFSSVQRIFEEIPEIPLTMSLKGTTEMIVFGTPLSDRTPYRNLLCLEDGQYITFCGEKATTTRYWTWEQNDICKQNLSLSGSARKLYDLFLDSISIRLGTDENVRAYLSGGLDSRCVVAGLINCGARVTTYNFSPEKTYDQLISRHVAKELGTHHHTITLKEDEGVKQHSHTLNAHFPVSGLSRHDFSRPQVVWTGDGGSVGAGYVYLHQDPVELLRHRKTSEAIAEFLSFNKLGVGARILKCPPFNGIKNAILDWVEKELDRYNCPDPGRKLFVFLMKNDQRRHFFAHLEDIDRSRIEYLSPFFDPEFLTYFSSLPIDECLYHKMYMKWVGSFPNNLLNIPWQAYPGHVPCPLPMPEGGRGQWDRDRQFKRGRIKYLLKTFSKEMNFKNFPDPLISKTVIQVVRILVMCNFYRYSYLLDQALSYNRYWRVSNGVYENDLYS